MYTLTNTVTHTPHTHHTYDVSTAFSCQQHHSRHVAKTLPVSLSLSFTHTHTHLHIITHSRALSLSPTHTHTHNTHTHYTITPQYLLASNTIANKFERPVDAINTCAHSHFHTHHTHTHTHDTPTEFPCQQHHSQHAANTLSLSLSFTCNKHTSTFSDSPAHSYSNRHTHNTHTLTRDLPIAFPCRQHHSQYILVACWCCEYTQCRDLATCLLASRSTYMYMYIHIYRCIYIYV